jgi:hypothetical protein
MTRLAETVPLKGATLTDCTYVGGQQLPVTRTGTRTPAYFRAKAVAAGATIHLDEEVSRADAEAPGTAVIGRLLTEAAVDTGYKIVQKWRPKADESDRKRVSTSETTWGAWRPILEGGKAVVADIADAGALASFDPPTGWSLASGQALSGGGFAAGSASVSQTAAQLAKLINDLIDAGILTD